MQKKFAGSVEELKRLISDSGVLGHWIDEGDFIVFHADEGEAFNFWPETGAVQLVGSPASRKHFEELFDRAASNG